MSRDADRQVSAAERLFRASFEHAPIGKALVAPDGRFLEVNRMLCDIVGYDEAALRTKAFQEITHPEDVGADVAQYGRLARGEISAYEIDKRYLHADGRLVWIHLAVAAVCDEAGALRYAIAQIRDITEAKATAEALGRYRAVVEYADDAIVAQDLEGRILTWNRAAERLYGYGADEVVGREMALLVPPAGQAAYRELLATVRAGGSVEHLETRLRAQDGTLVDVQLGVSPVRDAEGRVVGVSAIGRDITDRVAAERARTTLEGELAAAEALFRGAFERAPIGIVLSHAEGARRGRIVQANRALAELTGHALDDIPGRPLSGLAHPEDRGRLADALARLDAGAERVQVEQRLLHADGAPVWALLSCSLVPAAEGRPPQVITQVLDISDRKHFEGRLQHLADHDALTGLFNRRRFEVELDRALAHAVLHRSGGALLLLDVDNFKHVNDTLGHPVGDRLITRVGAVLAGELRETDVLARLGGDEFAVILPGADEATAMATAERLRSAIRRQGGPDRQARLTASVGVTLFDAAMTGEDLLVEADIAMYAVKDAGRDGARVFRGDERERERVSVRATWVERLRDGLGDERFRLFAQPIAGIGAVTEPWYELLLRFEDADGELIAPGTFLPIAERHDLVGAIDRWVLAQAVRMLHDEHVAGRTVALAVNLSGRTVSDGDLIPYLEELLAAHPVPPGRLVVEVTETAAIVNIERARELAQRLHELGCRFALDDFGAGFASFYYLKHLDFDYLKIDGEFVRQLTHNATDQLVIQAVVNIARGLGTQTVALLHALGVDYGQGHHLGRPRPVAEVLPSCRPAGSAA